MFLASIRIFPVKSGRGVALAEAEVEPQGLRHDRRYMVVDPRGTFVSQRQLPAMAELSLEGYGDTPRLVLGGRQAELQINSERTTVKVWQDQVQARDCGDRAATLLSDAFQRPLRLVFQDPEFKRQADTTYATEGDIVSLADGFPLLLVTQSSFREVALRTALAPAIESFRANVVVEGCPPFAEDDWAHIAIGETEFAVVKPCTRCSMVDLEPTRGSPGANVLSVLASFRRQGNKVIFGENLIPRRLGTICVGDPIRVMTRRSSAR